jgi:hypothetical protein
MITRDEVFGLILGADPSFEPAWREFEAEAKDESEKPYYWAFNSLARHLIACLQGGHTDRFGSVFDIVERLLEDGEKYVRDAVVVGLLEDLQNLNLHDRTRPDQLEPWLGPLAAQAWADVEAFWSTGTIIPDRGEH